MNLIIRILGNDLSGLHGENQTYNNLKFTLENEPEFKNTDKIFLLNRIYNQEKKNSYIDLLEKHNKKYIVDEFDINKFHELDYVNDNKNHKFKKLYHYNLYLINNNGSRNFCINYGKKNNYKWIYPLDSNSYFTEKMFSDVINNIHSDTKYLILPQVRLGNENIDNEELINNNYIKYKKTFEPQIAFRNDCDFIFNDKLPYGSSPKAELLRVLGIEGKWKNWVDNTTIYGIKDRPKINEKYQILSYVIRLNSYNSNNNIKNNYYNRVNGLQKLIDKIKKENYIIENFENEKKNNNYLEYFLLFILLILILKKCYKNM